jgi:glycosyltransferase involved in cell wall biosynthesis
MSLRIAQVAPLWGPIPPRAFYGGIEVFMKLLCDELVERGHDVTLFASADCHTRARLQPVVELNLYDLCVQGRAYAYESYINSMFADLFLEQRQFDLAHFHCALAWLPTAAMLQVPGLFTVHTPPTVDDEWVLRRWPNVPVNGISHAQMRALAPKLQREFPIVHNGCDFAAYPASFESGNYLAFLGRHSAGKNPRGAIDVARASGLPIIVAGQPQNQQEEAYFDAEVRPLIDGQRVQWIGAVDHAQKVALLRDATALIFPIQGDEAFGLVMIEAMACGTPVVALERGPVPEIVDPGITGYYASSLDALPDLVSRAAALDRAEVRRVAESRFSHAVMVSSYEALYSEVLARSRSSCMPL